MDGAFSLPFVDHTRELSSYTPLNIIVSPRSLNKEAPFYADGELLAVSRPMRSRVSSRRGFSQPASLVFKREVIPLQPL